MRVQSLGTLFGLTLIATACTNSEDPQLAMCQAVAKQLTNNTVASWDKIEQADASRKRTVSINYGTADNRRGAINCDFPINSDGVVDTAPSSVVYNGAKVGTRELLTAGAKASAELLKGTAANTVVRSKELANEASQLASEVAAKARDTAVDATRTVQEKIQK